MVSLTEDQLRMVRRNKLLGMWAAEKLSLTGRKEQKPIQTTWRRPRSSLSGAMCEQAPRRLRNCWRCPNRRPDPDRHDRILAPSFNPDQPTELARLCPGSDCPQFDFKVTKP